MNAWDFAVRESKGILIAKKSFCQKEDFIFLDYLDFFRLL